MREKERLKVMKIVMNVVIQYCRYFSIICLTLSMGLGCVEWGHADVEHAVDKNSVVLRRPTQLDKNISKVVAKLIQDYHYSGTKLNDEISALFFDEYFLRLDPNRYFFLQSDIDEFSPKKTILDDLILIGNINFAFEVYERLLQRIEERVKYVEKVVKKGFDFTKDEYLIVDRDKVPWAQSKDELDEIWRKRIKNQLLLYEFQRDEEGENVDSFGDQMTPEEKVLKRYESYYKYFLDNDNADILEYYLTSLLQIFDPHSSYLNWRSIEDFDIHMKLSLQGIGATLRSEDGYTEVVSLVFGGPAYRDGRLQPGDRIIAVAQGSEQLEDVIEMPLKKVVRKIRGPKGTTVRISVIKSLNSPPTVIDLVRDEVKLTDEEAKGRVKEVKGNGNGIVKLGVIEIPSFYADFEAIKAQREDAKITSRDVKKIVNGMIENDQVEGLLIDLRFNGGGSLEEAINLTGLFIPEGPVVQVRNRRGVQVRKDADSGFFYDLPLVVMINRSSASASEIFSGAIKDYGRGIIVGDMQTHGKGTVQTILKLNRLHFFRNKKSGAMKYTMAKFYRTTGASTQKKGIIPNSSFPSFLDHMEIGEAQLSHVMPWDEIEPLKIERVIDVTPHLPEIQSRSQNRLQSHQEFLRLVSDIERFGERKNQKTLSLNKAKRIALREEDEYWTKRSKTFFGNRESQPVDNKNEPKEQDDSDLYLEESLNILADLVDLMKKDNLAHKNIHRNTLIIEP